ncbi:MAG: two pore domain potassium channel family protein [Calditrichaeota bacterium]|nr:MAG: two pore domain potassium channel family protein [Calditrichota bacterium]
MNKNTDKKGKRRSKYFRNSIYFALWFLAIIVLTNFALVKRIFTSLNEYENFIYILIAIETIVIVFIIIRFKKFMFYLFGFFMFPLKLVFWIFPKKLFRLSIIVYLAINEMLNVIKSFKYKVISSLLYILASYLIIYNANMYMMLISLCIIVSILVLHYINRFTTITRPVLILQQLFDFLLVAWEKKKQKFLDQMNSLIKYESNIKEYKQKKIELVNEIWGYNRFFKRTSNFLNHHKSNLTVVYYFVISIIYTLFFTILSFALVFVSISKIDVNSFSSRQVLTFWDSIYFSFNTIFTTEFINYYPITSISKIFVVSEVVLGVFIGVILFLLFTSVIVENYKTLSNKISSKLDTEVEFTYKLINDNFEEPIEELTKIINREKLNKFWSKVFSFFDIDEEEKKSINITIK